MAFAVSSFQGGFPTASNKHRPAFVGPAFFSQGARRQVGSAVHELEGAEAPFPGQGEGVETEPLEKE